MPSSFLPGHYELALIIVENLKIGSPLFSMGELASQVLCVSMPLW